ncbi:PEP-CTERM sorting domain-containing protein [Candidatus Dojkabacteria bacterium]|nr:PEP-CTERM sorting domain-containing protein [Candidatus Dojkabacteria bacterium]
MEEKMRIKAMGPAIAAVATLMMGSAGAQAGTLTLTGAELTTYPGVSFPNFAPVISGDSIIINKTIGGPFSELMIFPLFSVGQLATFLPAIVQVSLNFTRISSDFDPSLLVGDGTKMAGGSVFDNNGGGHQFLAMNDVGTEATELSGAITLTTGLGFPSIGVSDQVDYIFKFASDIVSVTSTFRGSTITHDFDVGLINFSAEINLIYIADNDPEIYQINQVRITLPDTPSIPEPTTNLLIGLGLIGLVVMRNWRPAKRVSVAASDTQAAP